MRDIRSPDRWSSARPLGAVVITLCMELALFAATIKTKDGKIVEGKIRGMIVQKGELELTKHSDEGTIHTVTYVMSNGEDITAIDEDGVHRSRVWLVSVSQVGGLPDDFEVFKPGQKTGERVSAKGKKYHVFAIDLSPQVPSKEKLLGEFREIKGKDAAVPALHVSTKEGEVEVAVAEIVAFKAETKDSGAKKKQEK